MKLRGIVSKLCAWILVFSFVLTVTGCNKISVGGKDAEPATQMTVTFDEEEETQSISPYIYGGFLEHMGKTVYTGLWAEMLEDRKFFYGVDTAESPWKSTSEQKLAIMSTEDAFAGEMNVVLEDGVGIAQRNLATEEKDYDGYLWISVLSGTPTLKITADFSKQIKELELSGKEFAKYEFTLTSENASENGKIVFEVAGGTVAVGAVSFMGADNISGMRADTLELLKELNATIYRWPGGNFASGYNWKDGVGERDRRAPKRNLAWAPDESQDAKTISQKGVSEVIDPNDFGTDEFLEFCKIVDAEPYICINTGLGTIEEAVDWIDYCNGTTETTMGAWRAENGHKDPYNVAWWGIGNEMYGDWQLGYVKLEEYVKRHNAFVDAIEALPYDDLHLVAVGHLGESWSLTMLQEAGDNMTEIAEHIYEEHDKDNIANAYVLRDATAWKIETHRMYRDSMGGLYEDVRLVFDEFAYDNATLPSQLRDGLGVAATMHEFIRNSDMVAMANYSCTINANQGCIITTKTDAMLEGSGLAISMYSKYFGTEPIAVTSENSPLDVVAAYSEDGDYVTIAVVNPTDENYDVKLEGLSSLGKKFEAYRMTGMDEYAINISGDDTTLRIEEEGNYNYKAKTIRVDACTSVIYKIELKP